MKHLMTFESFEPKEDEVEKALEIIKTKYEIKEADIEMGETHSVKYIIVDDRVLYITGPLANKSRLRKKIFNDISDDSGLYSEASINKAIKLFIDSASE